MIIVWLTWGNEAVLDLWHLDLVRSFSSTLWLWRLTLLPLNEAVKKKHFNVCLMNQLWSFLDSCHVTWHKWRLPSTFFHVSSQISLPPVIVPNRNTWDLVDGRLWLRVSLRRRVRQWEDTGRRRRRAHRLSPSVTAGVLVICHLIRYPDKAIREKQILPPRRFNSFLLHPDRL